MHEEDMRIEDLKAALLGALLSQSRRLKMHIESLKMDIAALEKLDQDRLALIQRKEVELSQARSDLARVRAEKTTRNSKGAKNDGRK